MEAPIVLLMPVQWLCLNNKKEIMKILNIKELEAKRDFYKKDKNKISFLGNLLITLEFLGIHKNKVIIYRIIANLRRIKIKRKLDSIINQIL